MKKTIICIDRDGTIIHDEKYHLGRTHHWKKKIKILHNVISGIKILRKIKNVKIYMITNQPGIAIKNFPLLTEKRGHQVCQYILARLKKKGAKLDGYFLCGRASPSYIKKRKEYKFNNKLVCDCNCIKPKGGMIVSVLKAEHLKPPQAKIYVMGDRVSDIKTALKAKGTGVFIPFAKEQEEIEKVKKLKNNKKVYISKHFLDACTFILKKETRGKK